MLLRLSTVFAVVALIGVPSVAHAQAADAVRSRCINLSEQAQTLRDTGRLRAAVDAFTACAKLECPKTVRRDCEGWLEGANKSLPTVIVTAVDAQGAEVTQAHLRVDHEVLLDGLTRMAISVDPGEHIFSLDYGNGRNVEQRLVIREGEHSRAIVFHIPSEPAPIPPATVPAPVPAPIAPEEPPRETRTGRTNQIVGGVVGVVGLGAAAASVYFESQVLNTSSTLTSECPNKCRSTPMLVNQLSTVSNDRIGAGVTLGVSIVAVGVATYVFIARPFGRVSSATPATAFDIAPSSHGATASWTLGF